MADRGNTITEEDAFKGILHAANEIGSKQIKPILNELENKNYLSILNIIAKSGLEIFNRKQLNELINISKNDLDNFLSNMIELDILEHVGPKNSGNYQFTHSLYYIYFEIKNLIK